MKYNIFSIFNMKKYNIQQYYINKNIEKQKEKAKLTGNLIRQNNIGNLENQIWENLISRICKSYKVKNIIRNISYKKLIGCDEIQLYNYLQNLLPENLKMEDYPLWEVDHIKAISNYDLTDEKSQYECFHYTNLQPLLKELNRKKSNK